MYLTEAGQIMLRATQSIYTIFRSVVEELEYCTNELEGHLKIGLLSSIEDDVFINFLVSYYEQYPRCKVSLYMLSRQEIWEKLENNQIDIAILYLPEDTIKDWNAYSSKEIASEELFLLHSNEALNQKTAVQLSETINHNWVFYPKNFYINDILRNNFIYHNLNLPPISGYFSTPKQLQQFSQQTGCFSALPKSYVDVHHLKENHHMLPFDPPIKYTLAFVYQKEKAGLNRVKNFFTSFDIFLTEKDYASRLKR